MDHLQKRISYVERILGFMFETSFTARLEELGFPEEDIEIWYRNAQLYSSITNQRSLQDDERVDLVTLIESARFHAMCSPASGERCEFDVSAYNFSEEVLSYKDLILSEVLRQENEFASPPYLPQKD